MQPCEIHWDSPPILIFFFVLAKHNNSKLSFALPCRDAPGGGFPVGFVDPFQSMFAPRRLGAAGTSPLVSVFQWCVYQMLVSCPDPTQESRVLPTLVGSGNARPVLCYPNQYLPSPTSTSALQLAALHCHWVGCALYRVSQRGIFFARAHVWKRLMCESRNQVDDVHLLTNQHAWWRLWAITKNKLFIWIFMHK